MKKISVIIMMVGGLMLIFGAGIFTASLVPATMIWAQQNMDAAAPYAFIGVMVFACGWLMRPGSEN